MSLQWPIIVEAKQKQFYTHEINTITSVLFISLRIKPVNQSKQSSTAYIHFCTNFPIMHFPLTSDPKYNFLLYLRVVSNAIERLVILIRMIIENLNYFRLILLFPFVDLKYLSQEISTNTFIYFGDLFFIIVHERLEASSISNTSTKVNLRKVEEIFFITLTNQQLFFISGTYHYHELCLDNIN